MEILFKTKFKIGDRVYHITPESAPGIIIDIVYTVYSKQIDYIVAIGFDNELRCTERELSLERSII